MLLEGLLVLVVQENQAASVARQSDTLAVAVAVAMALVVLVAETAETGVVRTEEMLLQILEVVVEVQVVVQVLEVRAGRVS